MARPVVKKQDIEDAAIYLFATQGLARTTIKDIARKAGVTEGALYRHYSGKNDMAWQLFCQELKRFSDQLNIILFARDSSTGDRLEQTIRFIYAYYQQNPLQFAFIMLTQHGFPEEELLDEATNPNDMAVRFVAEAIESGEVPVLDPVLTSGLLLGLVLQPLVMHRYDRIELTESAVDEIVAAAKSVLRVE